MIIRAPIDVMNNVLKTVSYSCKFKDGCVSDMTDTICTVDDEGYRGKGPLTASANITVSRDVIRKDCKSNSKKSQ